MNDLFKRLFYFFTCNYLIKRIAKGTLKSLPLDVAIAPIMQKIKWQSAMTGYNKAPMATKVRIDAKILSKKAVIDQFNASLDCD